MQTWMRFVVFAQADIRNGGLTCLIPFYPIGDTLSVLSKSPKCLVCRHVEGTFLISPPALFHGGRRAAQFPPRGAQASCIAASLDPPGSAVGGGARFSTPHPV